jgi:hypothetical protein
LISLPSFLPSFLSPSIRYALNLDQFCTPTSHWLQASLPESVLLPVLYGLTIAVFHFEAYSP